MSSKPTFWQSFRQILGRAFRETGQALDRAGIKVVALSQTKHSFYDDPVMYEDYLSRHRHLLPLLKSGQPRIHPNAAFLAPCSTLIGSVYVDRGASVWYGAVLRADACFNAKSFNKPDYLTDEELGRKLILDDDDKLRIQEEGKVQQQRQQDNSQMPASAESADPTAEKVVQNNKKEEESATNDYNDNNSHNTTTTTQTNPLVWKLTDARFDRDEYHAGGGIFIGQDSNIQDGCILTSREGHCIVGKGVTVGHLAQIHSATVGDFALIGMGCILQHGCIVESEALVAAGAVVAPGQVVRSGELWVGNPARKLRDLTTEQRVKLHYQSSEYVAVAMTHRDVMELGGNLTESMLDRYELLLQARSAAVQDNNNNNNNSGAAGGEEADVVIQQSTFETNAPDSRPASSSVRKGHDHGSLHSTSSAAAGIDAKACQNKQVNTK